MKPQTIFFDLDDTLVHCNKYFDFIIEQFTDQMETMFASYRASGKEIRDKQLEIDTAGVNAFGFTTDHFPQSLVETYRYFSDLYGRETSRDEEDLLLQLGRSVYDQEVEPYPYMVEALEELRSDGHTLYLYTGGVAAIQKKKIEAMELGAFFGERIFVRQHKTTSALEDILAHGKFDRAHTWMIGNSIRTDIMPALETGIHAIYVPAVTEWMYNMVEITAKPKGAFLTVPSLRELRDAIRGYLESAAS